MARSVDQMIDDILRREGGFVNNPDDRGGATNMGITIGTLSRWMGQEATAAEVQALDEGTAREIYRSDYFFRPHLDKLPEGLQPFMFDSSVHHGQAGAVRMLQRTLRKAGHPVAVDGVVGPQTTAAAHDALGRLGPAFQAMLVDERRQRFVEIAAADPSQKQFLPGWLNRLEEFAGGPLT